MRYLTLILLLIASPAYGWGLLGPMGGVADGGGATDYTSDSNIQAYWMMQQSSGATALDGTANDNDLTAYSDGSGPTQVSDVPAGVGDTYSHDWDSGSSESYELAYASMDADFPGRGVADEVSLGCWIKMDADSRSVMSLEREQSDSSYKLQVNAGEVWFGLSSNGSSWDIGTLAGNDGTISTDGTTWNHIVGVFDDSADMMYVYLDGSLDNSTSTTTGSLNQTSSESFSLGRDGGSKYDGHMYECFVFDRALSGAEVTEIYTYGLDGGN